MIQILAPSKQIYLKKNFTLTVLVTIVSLISLNAQLIRNDSIVETKNSTSDIEKKDPYSYTFRFGIDGLSAITGFKQIRSSLTFRHTDRTFYNINIGLNWPGSMAHIPYQGNVFESRYRSVALEFQYFKKGRRSNQAYFGAGPFYRYINGLTGKGYFIDLSEDQVTVFKDASLRIHRLGIVSSIGGVVTTRGFNLDIRFDIPIFVQFNSFRNLDDPITLNDFSPEFNKAQYKGGRVLFYPRVSFYFGHKF